MNTNEMRKQAQQVEAHPELLQVARDAYTKCAGTRRGACSALRCYEAARSAARKACLQTSVADACAERALEELSGRSLNELRWAAFEGGVGG